jgi:DNA-binding XRE family transcriptional regulator
MKKKGNIGSMDEILDSLYGKPGTEQRNEFRREAYAYCVGQIVHDARKREGMTQSDLANLVGTTKSYISRIENGAVEPSAGLFLNIINILGLNISRTMV